MAPILLIASSAHWKFFAVKDLSTNSTDFDFDSDSDGGVEEDQRGRDDCNSECTSARVSSDDLSSDEHGTQDDEDILLRIAREYRIFARKNFIPCPALGDKWFSKK
mmetsp:Transcript_6157/g.8059  ORF Transcript_6157/g.8059 Transcript_6157/m.8059 type:complete len:106 (+) Transcript_6157:671-988(+)|eukprot:5654478-Ditylum_brightwellii.AAC.1